MIHQSRTLSAYCDRLSLFFACSATYMHPRSKLRSDLTPIPFLDAVRWCSTTKAGILHWLIAYTHNSCILNSDKTCFGRYPPPLLLTMSTLVVMMPLYWGRRTFERHGVQRKFVWFNVVIELKISHSDHLFSPQWTSCAPDIMGGLVHYSHRLFPLCSRFPLCQLRQIFHLILPTPTNLLCFISLMLSWTPGSSMHYCMVSNIILCLHMQVLINDGHRHIHRYPCCHLVEYLWARNMSTTAKAELIGLVINKCWPIRWAMVIVIILLHALITINFAAEWSFVHSAFIENGKSFQTVSLKLQHVAQAAFLAQGIAASMSTIITDLYMVRVTLSWELSTSAHSLDSRFGIAG